MICDAAFYAHEIDEQFIFIEYSSSIETAFATATVKG